MEIPTHLSSYKPNFLLMKKIAIAKLFIRPYILESIIINHIKSLNNKPKLSIHHEREKMLNDTRNIVNFFKNKEQQELLNKKLLDKLN